MLTLPARGQQEVKELILNAFDSANPAELSGNRGHFVHNALGGYGGAVCQRRRSV